MVVLPTSIHRGVHQTNRNNQKDRARLRSAKNKHNLDASLLSSSPENKGGESQDIIARDCTALFDQNNMSCKPVLLHFKFEDFVNLPDEMVSSESQTDCQGNVWSLGIYPGVSTAEEDDWITMELYVTSGNETFVPKLGVFVRDANGTVVAHEDNLEVEDWEEDSDIYVRFDDVLMKRSRILDETNNILNNGALDIDVTIQYKIPEKDLYHPQSNLSKNILKLLENGDKADISFDVQGKIFRAHSQIIHANAPILASFCDKQDDDSTVVILDTHPDIFHHVLKFVYAEIIPTNDVVVGIGQDLVDAANRYGLVDMKLAVENVLVQECVVNLKMSPKHSRQLRESADLLTELLILVTSKCGDSVSVTELRQELGKRGLDIDGSKQALVSRLNDAKRRRVKE
ncbi:hypothetical protein HJC23_002789 [Cyclotella cryptica]|uniref:BTB domain-containing protein n=1 Tax=Cyclotella cryptica TaxID=29204 RepID=A0ABD3PEY5_9STRA